jgi:hypothetical protein
MIQVDKEFYSSPYYFLMRDKGNKYSLYFSIENTLTEARKKDEVIHFDKKHGDKVKKHLSKIAKEKKVKNQKVMKKDLEELVNADGVMASSKIPILDPKLHPRKTMDQTVAAAAVTNDPISRGYRTYYGESVDPEMTETDLSKAFGYDETKDMDGPDAYKYFIEKLELEPSDAEERVRQQGKNPFKDKKKITISEIQKQKMIKMVEDILMKKRAADKSDVTSKEKDVETTAILKKNLKSLKRQAEREGLSLSQLVKLVKSE